MAREIKFRAYDTADNPVVEANRRMSYFGSDYFISDDGFIQFQSPTGQSPLGDHNQDRFILMQYTGLKDKNGVEIYEGDVVRKRKRTKKIVEWIDTKAYLGWNIHRPRNYMSWEVIGNIYESPELLVN